MGQVPCLAHLEGKFGTVAWSSDPHGLQHPCISQLLEHQLLIKEQLPLKGKTAEHVQTEGMRTALCIPFLCNTESLLKLTYNHTVDSKLSKLSCVRLTRKVLLLLIKAATTQTCTIKDQKDIFSKFMAANEFEVPIQKTASVLIHV